MIAISSTQPATCGNTSLTHAPDCPCCWNLNGDARILSLMLNTVVGVLKGIGFPLSRSRRGLGSKVSTWEGPPSMKRKMTDLALAAKCGFFGAKGLSAAAADLSANR